jgi:hypothetical protein
MVKSRADELVVTLRMIARVLGDSHYFGRTDEDSL